jgi:site-specific DNA-methyltransferase (adenine-specific)
MKLELNNIYLMDCFKFLSKVSKNSIDLAVIDPPYNLKKAQWDTFKSHDDFLSFTFKWIDLLIPTIKETGSLYIFNTPYNAAFILRYLLDKGLIFQNWITWDKRDGLSVSKKNILMLKKRYFFLQNLINIHLMLMKLEYRMNLLKE